MPSYRTIAQPLRYEIEKIKGSRFIADVAPVTDDTAAGSGVTALHTHPLLDHGDPSRQVCGPALHTC
jgi:putative IMPACT (imprinted ancient) family translation regulator